MKRSALALVVLLAGCAGTPGGDDGALIGERSAPRERARLHTELAAAYYSRGNMAVALEELGIAVAADPQYAPAHSVSGVVYMELRENEKARQSFERALQLAPDDPDINHNYGWFVCQTGRPAESIAYFERAVRNPLYPAPWRSYSAAGVCLMQGGKWSEAERYFRQALRLEPDEPTSLLKLGEIRYRQGDLEEARRLVSRFNQRGAPTAESLWLALRIERRLGQQLAERSYANQLRRRFPGSPEVQALQRGDFD